jgi:Flp pilus assembly protein TadG
VIVSARLRSTRAPHRCPGRAQRLAAREQGAAAVEMALVLPLLLLLVFGIIEFGFIFNRYISVTHAAREGVRQLAVGVDPGAASAAAEGSVPELGSGVSCSPSSATDAAGVETAIMSCRTVYEVGVPALLSLPSSITLDSEARMRKE